MTGGCAKIVQDIPPYMIADGNPAKVRAINAVGLKRRGFSEGDVRAVKRAHRLLYRDGLNATDALAGIEALEDSGGVLKPLIEFVKTTERGLHGDLEAHRCVVQEGQLHGSHLEPLRHAGRPGKRATAHPSIVDTIRVRCMLYFPDPSRSRADARSSLT